MKKIYLSIFIVLLIALITLVCCEKKQKIKVPEDVVKTYCDMLVEGNYKDIIDLVYFPTNELITEEKIEELKNIYYEEMKSKNITSCEYSLFSEKENVTTYEITLNANNTDYIEVDENNKLVINELYDVKHIITNNSSKLKIDGKYIDGGVKVDGNTLLRDDKDIEVKKYEITGLSYVNYDYEVENVILKNNTFSDTSTDYIDLSEYFVDTSLFKDEFIGSFDNDIKAMVKEIADVGFKETDKSSIYKYFLNNEDVEKVTQRFVKSKIDGSVIYEFKDYDEKPIYYDIVKYISDEELEVYINVPIIQHKACLPGKTCVIYGEGFLSSSGKDQNVDIEFTVILVKENNIWKIKEYTY